MSAQLQPHPWELVRVVLERSRFDSLLFMGEDIDPNISPQPSYEIQVARSETRAGLLVRLTFSTSPEEKTPYHFDLTWDAEFSVPPDATDEATVAFAGTSGLFILWPYARAHIADATGKMGFPPLTLATVAIPPPESVRMIPAEADEPVELQP